MRIKIQRGHRGIVVIPRHDAKTVNDAWQKIVVREKAWSAGGRPEPRS